MTWHTPLDYPGPGVIICKTADDYVQCLIRPVEDGRLAMMSDTHISWDEVQAWIEVVPGACHVEGNVLVHRTN